MDLKTKNGHSGEFPGSCTLDTDTRGQQPGNAKGYRKKAITTFFPLSLSKKPGRGSLTALLQLSTTKKSVASITPLQVKAE